MSGFPDDYHRTDPSKPANLRPLSAILHQEPHGEAVVRYYQFPHGLHNLILQPGTQYIFNSVGVSLTLRVETVREVFITHTENGFAFEWGKEP